MARKKVVELPAIVDVSLADSDRNYDSNVTFLEKDFRVLRIGADGDALPADDVAPLPRPARNSRSSMTSMLHLGGFSMWAIL